MAGPSQSTQVSDAEKNKLENQKKDFAYQRKKEEEAQLYYKLNGGYLVWHKIRGATDKEKEEVKDQLTLSTNDDRIKKLPTDGIYTVEIRKDMGQPGESYDKHNFILQNGGMSPSPPVYNSDLSLYREAFRKIFHFQATELGATSVTIKGSLTEDQLMVLIDEAFEAGIGLDLSQEIDFISTLDAKTQRKIFDAEKLLAKNQYCNELITNIGNRHLSELKEGIDTTKQLAGNTADEIKENAKNQIFGQPDMMDTDEKLSAINQETKALSERLEKIKGAMHELDKHLEATEKVLKDPNEMIKETKISLTFSFIGWLKELFDSNKEKLMNDQTKIVERVESMYNESLVDKKDLMQKLKTEIDDLEKRSILYKEIVDELPAPLTAKQERTKTEVLKTIDDFTAKANVEKANVTNEETRINGMGAKIEESKRQAQTADLRARQ